MGSVNHSIILHTYHSAVSCLPSINIDYAVMSPVVLIYRINTSNRVEAKSARLRDQIEWLELFQFTKYIDADYCMALLNVHYLHLMAFFKFIFGVNINLFWLDIRGGLIVKIVYIV